MRTERWSYVPTALGSILIAASAAAGSELTRSTGDLDWRLVVRMDLEFLGGLWLLAGPSARRARIFFLASFLGISSYDAERATVGRPPRPIFARIAVGAGWVMAADLAVVAVMLGWRPAAGERRAAWIDAHPRHVAATALIALGVGAAIEGSQIGRFPVVAAARSGGPSSPGLNYLVYLPSGYHRSALRWPLILVLHGAGSVGDDLGLVVRDGMPRGLEAGRDVPFVLVAPQSPRHGWDVGALDALLDEVLDRYWTDADRVYLAGDSMGGYGVWAFATARPERFAAMAPICGGGDPAQAHRLRDVPAWAFHGADDAVVPLEESRKMAAALEEAGGEVKLTVYPGVGHDAGTPTYADPGLLDWFLAYRRRRR